MGAEREDISGNIAERRITRGGREIEEAQYPVYYLPNQAKEGVSVVSVIKIALPFATGEPKTELIIAGNGETRTETYFVRPARDLWVLESLHPTIKRPFPLLVPTQGSFRKWLDECPSIPLAPFSGLGSNSSKSYDIYLFKEASKKDRIRLTAERGRNPYGYDQKLTVTHLPAKGRHNTFAQLNRLAKVGWDMAGLEGKLHLYS